MNLPATDLCLSIGRLAANHRVGAIGLTGSFARGEESVGADVDLIVAVSLQQAATFGQALAAAVDRSVHLHAFDSLPWHHPYHLCVRWLNCDRLPIKLVPRGAVIRRITGRDGQPLELAVPVEMVGHFVPIDTPLQATPPQPGSRFISAPPLGGFLL